MLLAAWFWLLTEIAQALEHHRAGRLPQAEAIYRRILESEPHHADALHLLGLITLQTGQAQSSVTLIERAIQAKSDVPQYHNGLGEALSALRKFEAATAAYTQALALKPDYAEAHNNLGLALQEQKRLPEAVAAFQQAVNANPDFADAHYNLGLGLHEMGKLDDAIDAYKQALALNPNDADIHSNLGIALKDQGKLVEAVAAFERALALKPDAARTCNNLGNALKKQGKLAQAIAAYRQALVLRPDFAEAHHYLGTALRAQGKLTEAIAAYRQLLALEPNHTKAAETFRLLVSCHSYDSPDHEDVNEIRAALNRPDVPEHDAMHLHFALGKIYEDCHAYDDAFSHYQQANQLGRKTSPFDLQELSELIQQLIHAFDPAFFTERTSYGRSSETPVFIVGLPRSGKTLAERIVTSHPQVHGAGELEKMIEIVKTLPTRTGGSHAYPECVKHLDRETSMALAGEYETHLRQNSGADVARITDTVPGNFRHLGLITLLFPRARVIHCRRDPLDHCLSMYFKYFARSGYAYTYDLSSLGAFYQQYELLMTHWRRVLPQNIYEIRYEDVVADPKRRARELIEFLGLSWDDRCLDEVSHLHKREVGHWRKYEKFLGTLEQSLRTD